jgi:hypothetical protein
MWVVLLVVGTLLILGQWAAIRRDKMVCPLCGHGISDHRLDSSATQPIGTYYCLICEKACE